MSLQKITAVVASVSSVEKAVKFKEKGQVDPSPLFPEQYIGPQRRVYPPRSPTEAADGVEVGDQVENHEEDFVRQILEHVLLDLGC